MKLRGRFVFGSACLSLTALFGFTVLTNCASAERATATVSTSRTQVDAVSAVVVVRSFPHDNTCFTEGLQWTASVVGGGFYESCGGTGVSSIQLTSLKGKAVKRSPVPDGAFGEGTVRLGNRLYQLTWRERSVFVRDPTTLKVLETRILPKEIAEGWGLTSRGTDLVVSDGSSSIFFLDPKAWKVTNIISVRNGDQPVSQLNELEFINGQLWANVWLTETLVVLDPTSGNVTSTVSLAGLRPAETLGNRDAVANGIAYDPKAKRIFVTGKLWPTVFEIRTKPLAK